MNRAAKSSLTIILFFPFVPTLVMAGGKTDITRLGQSGFRRIIPAGRGDVPGAFNRKPQPEKKRVT